MVVLTLGIQALGAADAECGMGLANAAAMEGWEPVAVQDAWLFTKRPLECLAVGGHA